MIFYSIIHLGKSGAGFTPSREIIVVFIQRTVSHRTIRIDVFNFVCSMRWVSGHEVPGIKSYGKGGPGRPPMRTSVTWSAHAVGVPTPMQDPTGRQRWADADLLSPAQKMTRRCSGCRQARKTPHLRLPSTPTSALPYSSEHANKGRTQCN